LLGSQQFKPADSKKFSERDPQFEVWGFSHASIDWNEAETGIGIRQIELPISSCMHVKEMPSTIKEDRELETASC